MIRKLGLASAAIVAAAFGVPAVASASAMTMPANTLVPLNTTIEATSHNTVITSSIGNITCNVVTLKGKVTKNNGTTFEGVEAAGSSATPCFYKAKEVPVTTPTLRSFTSTFAGIGSVSLFVKVHLAEKFVCTYETTGINFTYAAGASTLKVEGPLTVTPAACGTASINGDYVIETTGGGPIILD